MQSVEVVGIRNRNPLPRPQVACSRNTETEIHVNPWPRATSLLHGDPAVCARPPFSIRSPGSHTSAFLGIWALGELLLTPSLPRSLTGTVWGTPISACHLSLDLTDPIADGSIGLNSEPFRKNFPQCSFAVVNCKINSCPSPGAGLPSALVGFPLAMQKLLQIYTSSSSPRQGAPWWRWSPRLMLFSIHWPACGCSFPATKCWSCSSLSQACSEIL